MTWDSAFLGSLYDMKRFLLAVDPVETVNMIERSQCKGAVLPSAGSSLKVPKRYAHDSMYLRTPNEFPNLVEGGQPKLALFIEVLGERSVLARIRRVTREQEPVNALY